MKVLTLQIKKENFNAIFDGSQKQEERNIYPTTAKRYIVDPEAEDLELVKYDALYLINGRQKNARRLKVEVIGQEVFIETDENDKPLTYIENEIEYLVSFIHYDLGKVIETENCN